MKKTAIPPPSRDSKDLSTLQALKTAVELITGQTGGKINKLGEEATLADVIVRINQILSKLQD